MYVRKFQGESIDETIKLIKQELGPEAIILKTETFKGIKSALKKSKVEITAAITEKNLKKKMNVDKVLTNEQRSSAYDAPADYLVDMIDGYDKSNENLNGKNNLGYGNISLNKNVQKKNEPNNSVVNELVNTSSLDNFLNEGSEVESLDVSTDMNVKKASLEVKESKITATSSSTISRSDIHRVKEELLCEINSISLTEDERKELSELRDKVIHLEKSLSNINFNKSVKNDDVQNVLSILSRSGVSEEFINKDLLLNFYSNNSSSDIKKENFINYCVSNCQDVIKTEEVSSSKHLPKVFLYLGERGTGQSSLIKKIIKKQEQGEMFTLLSEGTNGVKKCTDKIIGINNFEFTDPAKLFSEVRKTISRGVNAHVDIKISDKNINDVYQMISLFKSSIKLCCIAITVSGRFSHRYNSNLLKKFSEYAEYFNLTFYDDCFDFGSIFNLFYENKKYKLSYISDGEKIPSDLKVAKSDLIVEKIFNI